MFLSLGFPMGAALFLSITLVMYFFKKKYHDFQNKLFQLLLTFTFIMLLLEISYVNTMNHMDKIPLINEIVCRLFLSGVLLWAITFFFYIVSIGLVGLSDNQKKKATSVIPYLIAISCAVLSIIDSFLEIDYLIDDGQFAIVGPATYLVYGVVGVLVFLIFILVLKNKNNYNNSLRLPVFFILFLISLDTLHLFIFEINDLTLILALIVSSLYFTVENQDRMLLKEVEEAKVKSEEVDKAKTAFLSKMSHEIRTPMNTIIGFSNSLLLEEDLTKEKVLEDAKSIHEASINLLDLINNILDLSKSESAKETIIEKEYRIANLITEINSLLESKSTQTNNNYDLDVDANIPSVYFGDYSKVLKIISAVTINALKYTSDGYINLNVSYENKEDKDYLIFVISNTGNKMPKNYSYMDFSDFSKLDYGTENKMDSEFLGLIIAKRLIDMMDNSHMEFKFENNTTKCVINICQKVIDRKSIGKDYLVAKRTNVVDCAGKKALVVDDNDINLKLAERLLKSYHFEVTKTDSGNECINLVKMNQYDIIFLDHMMPEMDGLKTIAILKNLNKEIPYIVAMTANSNDDSEDFYKQKGFNNYIGKPINKGRLDDLINEAFGGES